MKRGHLVLKRTIKRMQQDTEIRTASWNSYNIFKLKVVCSVHTRKCAPTTTTFMCTILMCRTMYDTTVTPSDTKALSLLNFTLDPSSFMSLRALWCLYIYIQERLCVCFRGWGSNLGGLYIQYGVNFRCSQSSLTPSLIPHSRITTPSNRHTVRYLLSSIGIGEEINIGVFETAAAMFQTTAAVNPSDHVRQFNAVF